ncbi:hypothetical protein ACH5RR_018090, partial [Cinchona calisaya]
NQTNQTIARVTMLMINVLVHMFKCHIGLPLPKRRCLIRNLSLTKKRDAKEVLTVEVNDNVQCIVVKDSQHFIIVSSCVLRKLAKHNVEKWSKSGD